MASPITFFRPTPYTPETKQQIWATILTDSHDLHCGCTEPISHMLHELIPPDSKYRHWTIDQFIKYTHKRQLCLFTGGTEEKGIGEAVAGPSTERPYKQRRRRRRRPTYRRRYYRTHKRRRRRSKVRRKKKTLLIKQWQPDTIRKCKIKGYITHVLGSEGKQFACYTDTRFDWVPPRTPGGGGFGVEKYTLSFLYDEYLRGNKHMDI